MVNLKVYVASCVFCTRDLRVLQVRPPAVLQPVQVRALFSLAGLHRDHPRQQRVQARGEAWGL